MRESGKSSRGCLWAVIAAGAFAVIVATCIVLAGVMLGNSARFSITKPEYGADEYPDLDEIWSYGRGDTKVVTIPIRGFIGLEESGDLFSSSENSSAQALLAIRRATRDPDVRAIILDIDSGGGGITASDILYEALLNFSKNDDGRVVVAVFGDVAASGAYYLALASDHIIARPTSITGSIGVLVQSLNVRELADKIGVHDVTIKSGENKDMLNPLKDLSPEQRAMLQGIVDELQTRFVGLVSERRELPVEDVRAIADGRIITASEAVRVGLVDEIGYWEDALEATAELLQVDEVKVFRYEEHFTFTSILRAAQHWSPAGDFLGKLGRTRLLYQWQL